MNPLKTGVPPELAGNINQIKSMMNMFSNPNIAFQQLAQSNPQVNQIMQMCQGRNPKDVFYSLAQQRGVDPEQFIRMLKS